MVSKQNAKTDAIIKKGFNLFLFLTWILTGGSILSIFQRNMLIGVLIGSVIMYFILFKRPIKKKIIHAFFSTIIFISVCLGVNYILSVKPQDPIKYVVILIEFVTSGLICIYFFSSLSYHEFLNYLYKSLSFFRNHAILNAVAILLVKDFSQKLTNSFNGYEVDSLFYLFYKVSDQYAFNLFGLSLIRNQGLFWEPGVLQFYLNLFLLLQLYIFKSKPASIILTVVALLTTYSTTAYLIMLFILTGTFISLIKKKPLIFLIIVIPLITILIPIFYQNAQNKLVGDKQVSSLVRFYDVIQQYFVIKNNALKGIGLDDQRYQVIKSKYLLRGVVSNYSEFSNLQSYNTILFVLGALGLPLGIIWLYGYAKQQLISEKKILLIPFFFVGVMVEPLLFKIFFMTFMFSGFMLLYIKIKYPSIKTLWQKKSSLQEGPALSVPT